jgi:hypothetical protein
MKKLGALALSLFLISGTAIADTPKDADPQPAKPAQPAKPKAAKKAEKTDSAFAAELEELRQTLQSQQEQLQMLKEELAKRDRQIDEAREAAATANSRAAEASSKAIEAVNTTAEVKSTAASLNATVSDLKASNEALKTAVTTEQAQVSKATEEAPASIRYKGITITPGGFLAAETVWRQRAVQADVNTPFTSAPFPNNGQGRLTEFNASGRQSRLSVLAEGKADNVKVTGYYETDWLSACTNSNNRQSNSYCNRQRQIWGQASLSNGLTFTGGQQWSLATETKKGLDNRTEALPMTIDAQYNVGFTWQRQFGFRVTKSFNDKVWLGFSVEGSQATLGGRGSPTSLFFAAPGQGGGLLNGFDATGYSINKTPDFIVKAAYEPGWGHYEIFGVISTFRDRAYPCSLTAGSLALPAFCAGNPLGTAAGAFNDTKTGGGIGVNLRVPVVAKKVDAGLHLFGGDGEGRYSSAQLADATTRPDGRLALIRGGGILGTLELHPTPMLDIYLNYGGEYAYRAKYTYTNLAGATVPVGYGSPLFNNSGCESHEGVPSAPGTPTSNGTCNGDVRNIQEGTLGFWHQAYKGPKGGIRWGIQYSYLLRNSWSGSGGLPAGTPGINAKAVDNMILTSFRYYIP